MKKSLCILLICIMVVFTSVVPLVVVPVCASDEGALESIVIDNTKGEKTKTYTLDNALAPGEFVMLEYTYTALKAEEQIYAEISYPYIGESWRPVLFDTDGKVSANRMRLKGSDTFYKEVGEISEGETYHVVGVLKAGQANNDSAGWIYLNGERVYNGYIPIDIPGGKFQSINVLPGVRAVFTKLTGMTSLAEFDYSGYLARLSSVHSAVKVTDSACANFTATLSDSFTVSELRESLTAPEGSTLTFMYNGRVLSENMAVVEGTRIFVHSKNRKLALSYRVAGGIIPFETTYQADHKEGIISKIPALTSIADFKNAIKTSANFSVSGIYIGEEQMESGYVANGMSLKLETNGGVLEYILAVDNEQNEGLISSEEYHIDHSNKQIKGVLKYTSVGELLETLTCAEGAEILGVYNGNDKVTELINSNSPVLIVRNGDTTEEYRLRLDDAGSLMRVGTSGYVLDGISNEIMGNTVMIEGKVSRKKAETEKNVCFYDPYRAEDGCVLCLSDDGNMYFWGHLLGKWESGREYSYKVLTDTKTAEATVYIDGKKVLEHLYVPFFVGMTNPIFLAANFEPGENFVYSRVSPIGAAEPDEKVYLDNFEVTSEYFVIEDDSIYISNAGYTVKQLLECINVTRGAAAGVYTKDEATLDDSEYVSDGMYVIAQRRNVQKRYVIRIKSEDVKVVGTTQLYKNEIVEEQLINDAENIPLLAEEDKLIATVRISNFNSKSENVNIYAAGYDKDGHLIAICTGQSEVPANTDGFLVNASFGAEELKGVHKLNVYLWHGDLSPFLPAEIRVQRDESRLDDYACRDIAPNMITSALIHPNYKGLIYEENGENDIQLMLRVYEESLPAGKTLEDYQVKIVILDPEENVILQSSEETITSQMNVTFSSKHLELGDYALKVSLIEKSNQTEIDYNIWPLRKREGSISNLSSFVDENGRFIKDGKPKFYIGMFGEYRDKSEQAYDGPVQVDFFKDNGVDGVLPFYTAATFMTLGNYSDAWLNKLEESGVDLFATMIVYREIPDDVINFRLKTNDDERKELEKRTKVLKDIPALAGYYVGDELEPETSDKIRWHSDIISSLDLERPTFYVDWGRGNREVFLHNASADIMGIDHYPVTYNQDDKAINEITKHTNYMTNNFINKPVWMALQCSNRGLWVRDTEKAQTPTEKQQRNMAMQAVCNGATGIWWYSYHELLKEVEINLDDSPDMAARVEQNMDLDEMVARTMGVNRLFARLGDIIMSSEEPPQVSVECAKASDIESIVKRYNGKSYIFAANTSIYDQTVSFTVNGAKSVKNIYTGESYMVDSQGKFTVLLENIGVGVFEIEQDDYLSHDSKLKNISFTSGGDSLVVTYDANGDMVINVPVDSEKIDYAAVINEKATLYINGEEAESTGAISGNTAAFRVIAEDRSETEYRVSICRK